MVGYGLSSKMFDSQRINFHSFEGNKNGSPKEHKFRVLPAFAPDKLFHKAGLHWGFKTVEGRNKAITCGLETLGTCPICDKVNELKGQLENIEAAMITDYDPQNRKALEEEKAGIEEYIKDHRRKPMYLWNIVTEEGTQKVLQLSWNGHGVLYEKIKWIFNNMKIDITNLVSNTLMYCNRSGLAAKTRYQYEMIQGIEKDLSTEVTKLTDLSKVYLAKPIEYLQEVVDTEIVPADKEDPNARNFDAAQPQAPLKEEVPVQQAAAQAGTHVQPAVQPAVQPTPVVEEPVAQPVQEQVSLTNEQDNNVSEMMAALQK